MWIGITPDYMLNLQVIHATKIYPWRSTTWPVSQSFTGNSLTISGEVSENFEFQIRKQSELHSNLSNKSSEDVSAKRRAIRIRFLSAQSSTGQAMTYSQVAAVFQAYAKTTNEDIELAVGGNTLDIYAPSTVIADLRARIEGVATPLHPGTKLTFITNGATPFCDSSAITVDLALDVDKIWEQKNVDVEAGMIDFARRYQALGGGENKKVAQSDDDEWD